MPSQADDHLPADVGGDQASNVGYVNQPSVGLYLDDDQDATNDELIGIRFPWVNGIALEHLSYVQVSQEGSEQLNKAAADAVIAQLQKDVNSPDYYHDYRLYGVGSKASDSIIDVAKDNARFVNTALVLTSPRENYEPSKLNALEEVYGERVYSNIQVAAEQFCKPKPAKDKPVNWDDIAKVPEKY